MLAWGKCRAPTCIVLQLLLQICSPLQRLGLHCVGLRQLQLGGAELALKLLYFPVLGLHKGVVSSCLGEP